ncbi:PWWP domain-containing DNA repair factor 3A-like [Erinaceus europaeus]|uniref:PWWP domain-containing DNA repair factor 3A-like n=2 Tax=Erinaceus europaeus TaxID=9365 RepID=A0ABM3WS61_ERIEU|nr:PWWP domain-containing DNA repair factor 3A-like [Erinaceus europaeus]
MPQGPRKAVPSSTPGQGPGGAEQQPEHEERGVQASETQCPGPSGASLLQDRQSSPGSLEAQEVQVDEAGPHRPHPGVIPEERGTERPCPSPAASGKEKETITPPAAALAAQHVLCLWKGQLWPARVLSSPGPSQEGAARGPADLELQILAAGNRVTVRDTDVKALTESYTESITYWLNSKSQRGIPHRQRETHRRALREALDILKERRQGGRAGYPGPTETTGPAQEGPAEQVGPRPRSQRGQDKPSGQTLQADKGHRLPSAETGGPKWGPEQQSRPRPGAQGRLGGPSRGRLVSVMGPRDESEERPGAPNEPREAYDSGHESQMEPGDQTGPRPGAEKEPRDQTAPRPGVQMGSQDQTGPRPKAQLGPQDPPAQRPGAPKGAGARAGQRPSKHRGESLQSPGTGPEPQSRPDPAEAGGTATPEEGGGSSVNKRRRKRKVGKGARSPRRGRGQAQQMGELPSEAPGPSHATPQGPRRRARAARTRTRTRPWALFPQSSTSSSEDGLEGASASAAPRPGAGAQAEAGSSPEPGRGPAASSLGGRKRKQGSPACPQPGASQPAGRDHPNCQQEEPCSSRSRAQGTALAGQAEPIRCGSVVWFKGQDLPYWPAVVQRVSQEGRRARVLLLEGAMRPERRGIPVALRRLKALHCREESRLRAQAARRFPQGLGWCLALVAQHREAQASGAFAGPLLAYWATDASLPLRRILDQAQPPMAFPRVDYATLECSSSSEEEQPQGQRQGQGQGRRRRPRPARKLLPDRTRAARDRANQKLVDFIVKERGADPHLLAVVQGRRPSRWLEAFKRGGRRVACVETYLEDEDQTDTLVAHLRALAHGLDLRHITRVRNDPVSFVVEVLLPEAIICGLAALEGLDYEAAQAKYLQGPPVHYREKELFDREILRMVRKRAARGGRR